MNLEQFETTLQIDEIIDQLESIFQGTVVTEINHLIASQVFTISFYSESEKESEIELREYEIVVAFDDTDRIKEIRILLDRSMTFDCLAEIVKSARLIESHIRSKFELAE